MSKDGPTPEQMVRNDLEQLLAIPAFRRFLYRHAIQNGGIFDQISDTSQGRNLAHFEGRRDLALEMLAEAETGQPVAHPGEIPILTAIQIMREQAQSAPTEKVNGRRDRYDRHRDLADGDGSDGSDDDV